MAAAQSLRHVLGSPRNGVEDRDVSVGGYWKVCSVDSTCLGGREAGLGSGKSWDVMKLQQGSRAPT